MKINIFVSRPTHIDKEYEAQYGGLEQFLEQSGLHPCRLGAGNYTLDAPLKGVRDLMNCCNGAIILGYPQHEFSAN